MTNRISIDVINLLISIGKNLERSSCEYCRRKLKNGFVKILDIFLIYIRYRRFKLILREELKDANKMLIDVFNLVKNFPKLKMEFNMVDGRKNTERCSSYKS